MSYKLSLTLTEKLYEMFYKSLDERNEVVIEGKKYKPSDILWTMDEDRLDSLYDEFVEGFTEKELNEMLKEIEDEEGEYTSYEEV